MAVRSMESGMNIVDTRRCCTPLDCCRFTYWHGRPIFIHLSQLHSTAPTHSCILSIPFAISLSLHVLHSALCIAAEAQGHRLIPRGCARRLWSNYWYSRYVLLLIQFTIFCSRWCLKRMANDDAFFDFNSRHISVCKHSHMPTTASHAQLYGIHILKCTVDIRMRSQWPLYYQPAINKYITCNFKLDASKINE